MNIYTNIVNPKTGRKVNIFGKLGQKILKKYILQHNLYHIYGGAIKAIDGDSTNQLRVTEIDANKDRTSPGDEIQVRENRDKQFHTNKRLLQYFEICNCPIIETLNCSAKNTQIDLINRIGSDSNSGEVYKIIIKNTNTRYQGNAVLKIMPILSPLMGKNNIKEISIATKLSETGCPYFSKVYGSGICENIIYNRESIFYHKSLSYFIKNSIQNNLILINKMNDNKLKITELRYMFGVSAEIRSLIDSSPNEYISQLKTIINTKKDLFTDLEFQEINESLTNPTLPGNILISEMAWGDVMELDKSSFRTKFQNNDWVYTFIHQILEAIYVMQENGIYHKDLHMGNILLLRHSEDFNDFTPLIHDFGTSINVSPSQWNTGNRKDDVIQFLTFLKIKTQLSEKYQYWIDNIVYKVIPEIQNGLSNKGNIIPNLISNLEEYYHTNSIFEQLKIQKNLEKYLNLKESTIEYIKSHYFVTKQLNTKKYSKKMVKIIGFDDKQQKVIIKLKGKKNMVKLNWDKIGERSIRIS